MPLKLVLVAVLVLPAVACQRHGLIVHVLDETVSSVLSELPDRAAELVKACDSSRELSVLPSEAPHFILRCVEGQFQVNVLGTRASVAALEVQTAELAAQHRFRYNISVPEYGSPSLDLHTNDIGQDVGERALRAIVSLLNIRESDRVWYQERHLSEAS